MSLSQPYRDDLTHYFSLAQQLYHDGRPHPQQFQRIVRLSHYAVSRWLLQPDVLPEPHARLRACQQELRTLQLFSDGTSRNWLLLHHRLLLALHGILQ